MENMYTDIAKKSAKGLMAFGIGASLVVAGVAFATPSLTIEAPKYYESGDKVSATEWNKMVGSIQAIDNWGISSFNTGIILGSDDNEGRLALLRTPSKDAYLRVEGGIKAKRVFSTDFFVGSSSEVGRINVNKGEIDNVGNIDMVSSGEISRAGSIDTARLFANAVYPKNNGAVDGSAFIKFFGDRGNPAHVVFAASDSTFAMPGAETIANPLINDAQLTVQGEVEAFSLVLKDHSVIPGVIEMNGGSIYSANTIQLENTINDVNSTACGEHETGTLRHVEENNIGRMEACLKNGTTYTWKPLTN